MERERREKEARERKKVRKRGHAKRRRLVKKRGKENLQGLEMHERRTRHVTRRESGPVLLSRQMERHRRR